MHHKRGTVFGIKTSSILCIRGENPMRTIFVRLVVLGLLVLGCDADKIKVELPENVDSAVSDDASVSMDAGPSVDLG